MKRDPDRAFLPDLEAIAAGYARGARLLVLSDLHNPTAALLDREALRELSRLAARHDAWVLVDEVYLSGVFDRKVESAARLGGRVIVTASLTKSYGLGPLRTGWAIAPPELVVRAQQIYDYLGTSAAFVADAVALHAFERLETLADRARRRRAETYPLVERFAEANGLTLHPAAGGFIAWLGLPAGLDSDRFVDHLAATQDTLAVPGAFFGVSDHLRISYGAPAEHVDEGLRRMGLALASLRA